MDTGENCSKPRKKAFLKITLNIDDTISTKIDLKNLKDIFNRVQSDKISSYNSKNRRKFYSYRL